MPLIFLAAGTTVRPFCSASALSWKCTTVSTHSARPVVGAFVHNQSICIFTKENFLQFSFAGKKLNDLEQAHIPDAVFEFGDTCFVTVGGDGCWRVTVE